MKIVSSLSPISDNLDACCVFFEYFCAVQSSVGEKEVVARPPLPPSPSPPPRITWEKKVEVAGGTKSKNKFRSSNQITPNIVFGLLFEAHV
jgi:hypothetical protein